MAYNVVVICVVYVSIVNLSDVLNFLYPKTNYVENDTLKDNFGKPATLTGA